MSYEAYKINTLVNQYRANPDMFNDDQLDELERLAQDNNINFKRNQSPFSIRRALQQASAGFIEGYTTFDLIPKEPRNTGEAIFRQLGHLAGFAPSILKAPIVGLAKAISLGTGRKTKDILENKITSSVMNAIDWVGPHSIPMIAQRKTVGYFQKGIKKAGLDTAEYMKRGAKTRAIAEEAVGLAGASAVSSVWKGTDAIIDSFIGGAIAGGAFGGIGNFVNVSRFHKGNAQQVEQANKYLRTALGSAVTGVPATLRGEPTEMQIYEYLLGGFFGYNTRPAKERAAGEWLTDAERFRSRRGGAEILDPTRSKDFSQLTKETQDYLLYEHPMPKSSQTFKNSEELGGTTGQALGYLENFVHKDLNHRAEAVKALGKNATEQKIRQWFGTKASQVYEARKKFFDSSKPSSEAYRQKDSMDFNDPVDIKTDDMKVQSIAKNLFPSVKDSFKNESQLANRISTIKNNNKDLGVESFINDVVDSTGIKMNKAQSSSLRNWFHQKTVPVHTVTYIPIKETWNKGKRESVTVSIQRGKDIHIDDNVVVGEKYGEFPLNRLTDGGFELLTHTVKKNKAEKILNSRPNYQKREIQFDLDLQTTQAIARELYNDPNNPRYIFSGIKEKNSLMIAPIKTEINGSRVTVKEIFDIMQNGLKDVPAPIVRAQLEKAYNIAKNKSIHSEKIFEDTFISNILHHAELNGLLGKTGDKITDMNGLVKMLQAKYATSPSDFNKRMQLLGNRMTALDPNSFIDILPDGQFNVMFVKDADMLRHLGYKRNPKTGKYPHESMTDGSALYRQAITERILDSLGLPDAGHFKPVTVGKGEGGLYATKSNGQLATPAWEAFMRANGVDAIVFGSSLKLRGDYLDTPIEYSKEAQAYSTREPNVYKIPIKDMEVSLSTYENMSKATSGESAPLQIFNTYDFLHTGYLNEWNSLVKKSQLGTQKAIDAIDASTNKQGTIDISKFENNLSIGNIDIRELPLDFVMKHLIQKGGDKKVGALLFDRIKKLDAKGELESDMFKPNLEFSYSKYQEMMDRIDLAHSGLYNTRFSLFKDSQMRFLKKFIISKYANPYIETGGKAWLKGVTPDMIPMLSVDPKYVTKSFSKEFQRTRLKNNKKIREGHVYLDEAHRQMPVVLGDKQYTLGEVWNFYTRKTPKPKKTTFKGIEDALELVVIRVPADSPSGVRVLRFGGFTNQKGAGALTHHKDDFYLGGADKDADSIKIFQGFSKKLRNIIKSQKDAKEHYRDPNSKEYNKKYAQNLEKEFEGKFLNPEEPFYISGRRKDKTKKDFIVELEGAEVEHYKQLVDTNFKKLDSEIDWVRGGKSGKRPIFTQYYGEKGTEYSYTEMGKRGDWSPLTWTPELLKIKSKVEKITGYKFNSAVVNKYKDGKDSIGFHRDNEPELMRSDKRGPVIASVSFGSKRNFILKDKSGKATPFALENGDLFLMKGDTQKNYTHGIAKESTTSPRINITFRRTNYGRRDPRKDPQPFRTKSKTEENVDKIIPQLLMFSPDYRLAVAKRSKSGQDGLENGLSGALYIRNIVDHVRNAGKGNALIVDTPEGKLLLTVRDSKKLGVDRMQYFRDLVGMVVNKSADASSDPTIKNYSHYRDMLLNSILKVELINEHGVVSSQKTYKRFKQLVESSKDLKHIARSIHQVKGNNDFRRIDTDLVKSLIKDGDIKLIGNTYQVTPKGYERLNLDAGERVILDPYGSLFQKYVNGEKIPNGKGLAYVKKKAGKGRDFNLTAEFIPNKPELIDLEAEVGYISQNMKGRESEGHLLKSIIDMERQFKSSPVGGKQDKQVQGSYTDRLLESYKALSRYLDLQKHVETGKKIPEFLIKEIENNTAILTDHISLIKPETLEAQFKFNKNLGLDNYGKTMAQFSTIESLHKQYIDMRKYIAKKESNVKLKEFTEYLYKKTNELKSIAGGGVKSQGRVEDMMNKHMEMINKKAIEKNLSPDLFLKYYHTLAMSPFTGKVKTRKLGRNKKVQFQFAELEHYATIHGSKLIPRKTREEYYRNLEGFINKLESSYNKPLTQEGIKRQEVKLEKSFKENEKPLRSFKAEKIVDNIQLDLPFKAAKKATYQDTKEGKKNIDYLALNGRDVKEIETFKKFINEHPVARENFDEWFGWFTLNFSDMTPRPSSDITIKDVYAINKFFKAAGDPKDLSFSVKMFLHDPRTVDHHLTARGFAKKVGSMQIKSPVTGKMISVAKIMSPKGIISEYNKNVKDRGIDIDTIRLTRDHEKLFKFIQELPDRDALVREVIDWREGTSQTALSVQGQKLNKLMDNYFTKIGDTYIYAKNNKGERYTDNQGLWKLDTDFNTFLKDTRGVLNPYMRWDKDGLFRYKEFYDKVININVDNAKAVANIRKIVGVDGLKRAQYEQRVEDRLDKAEKAGKVTDRKQWILDYRKKNPYKGIGWFDPSTYVPHMNFGKTEGARRAFEKSVKAAADAKYAEAKQVALEANNSEAEAISIAKKVRADYLRHMEDVGNFSSEFLTAKDIMDLGDVTDSVLDKSLEKLGLKTRIGPLEAREANLQGYDKSHKIFNDYIDKVVNGYYKTLSAIHGDKQIRDLKVAFKDRKVPQTEIDYFEKLYSPKDRRKSRRKGEEGEEIVIPMKDRRYKNYVDVWADYLKLHLQTVLGHQTYFPEKIMNEVERGIDPLYLKDKRNLFYLTSDQNMMKLYEKVWQKKKFKNAPFVGRILTEAPLDPNARKEYFSRKIHEFGRMEAQYELMTLLANTGTWATNIFSGNIMTGASAGIRNFINIFNKKKVYERLLTVNGKPILRTLDGKQVVDRKTLTNYLEERGIIDNFIQNEFEYNQGLTSNLRKAGISMRNFKRDLTVAMKTEKGVREESIREVATRYGVKDIMLKYGSFFMRNSEQFNRVNSYMAHAMQAIEKFGPNARELSIADPWVHEMAMKGIENTQFLYQNSFRPMFMRTATGKVLSRFKLFAWNSIRTRREFYKQAKLYGFKEGSLEYERAKDLFLTDMFMMALGGAFMFSIFDTSLAPPYDWIQSLADWLYGDKKERDMAFFGSPLGPANLLKPPIARIPEAMGQILTGDWEQFSGYTAYTLFPFGRMARQVNQLADDRVGRGLERAPEILLRVPYNKIQSRIERARRRSEQAETIEEFLG